MNAEEADLIDGSGNGSHQFGHVIVRLSADDRHLRDRRREIRSWATSVFADLHERRSIPMPVVLVGANLGANLGASETKDRKVDTRGAGRLFEFPACSFGRKRGDRRLKVERHLWLMTNVIYYVTAQSDPNGRSRVNTAMLA
ncbi:myocardin-related transcription factor A isoform X1, partial [Vespula squamosa]